LSTTRKRWRAAGDLTALPVLTKLADTSRLPVSNIARAARPPEQTAVRVADKNEAAGAADAARVGHTTRVQIWKALASASQFRLVLRHLRSDVSS